jgi:hypothetical protein
MSSAWSATIAVNFRDLETAALASPSLERCVLDAVPPTQLGLRATLGFLQDRDDLLSLNRVAS